MCQYHRSTVICTQAGLDVILNIQPIYDFVRSCAATVALRLKELAMFKGNTRKYNVIQKTMDAHGMIEPAGKCSQEKGKDLRPISLSLLLLKALKVLPEQTDKRIHSVKAKARMSLRAIDGNGLTSDIEIKNRIHTSPFLDMEEGSVISMRCGRYACYLMGYQREVKVCKQMHSPGRGYFTPEFAIRHKTNIT